MPESLGVPSGSVREAGGGVYVISLLNGTRIEASIRGRLKREHRTGSRVVIGDRVQVVQTDGSWTIESVDERDTELVRRGRSGRTPKILAANLDRVFAIVALKEPTATTQLIDRLLVLIESSGVRPTVVLNKVDLDGASEAAAELEDAYRGIGYRVFVTSASRGDGVEALHGEICDGSSAFIGPSGSGKSSLLNEIDPALDLRTGALSRKTRTGRHTTVGSRMIELSCGGLVADTPGFGDVGLWAVPPEDISQCFPEFTDPAQGCRFRGCTHVHEPDCGVLEALAAGKILSSRHGSYVTLRAEAEEAASQW